MEQTNILSFVRILHVLHAANLLPCHWCSFNLIPGGSGPLECLVAAQRARSRRWWTSTSAIKLWVRPAPSLWWVPARTSAWSAPSCWSSTGRSATWSATLRVTGSSQLTSPTPAPPGPVSDKNSGAPCPLLPHLCLTHLFKQWSSQHHLHIHHHRWRWLPIRTRPSTHTRGPSLLLCVCCPDSTAPDGYPHTAFPVTRTRTFRQQLKSFSAFLICCRLPHIFDWFSQTSRLVLISLLHKNSRLPTPMHTSTKEELPWWEHLLPIQRSFITQFTTPTPAQQPSGIL